MATERPQAGKALLQVALDFLDLDRALKERCEYLIFLTLDPMADKLRGDARFVALIKAVGLT